MNNYSDNKSTGSSSQATIKKFDNKFFKWLLIWWPVLLLGIILVIAGVTKYIYPNNSVYSLMVYLIKAISVIMIVMYVIYTRLLSLETQRMAEASIGLYNSEKGTVLAELTESVCDFDNLLSDAKKITKTLHISDKKLGEEEFSKLVKEKNIPAISLLIKNISARRIEASKISYKVRHTGCEKYYDINCDISQIGTIIPWADKEIALVIAPEGEIEIIINSIDYLDGGVVQRINLKDNYILERIRKPEKKENE
jgi:hypothetical protein